MKALNELRIGLTEKECHRAFAFFDRDGSGTVCYDEFLRTIVGNMNEYRQQICLRAFDKMDKDRSGVIDISDILGVYDASKHPDVIAGKKDEDEILFEFLDTFEQHHSPNPDDRRDGKVSKDEWLAYYNSVSMSIDRDDYFALMMNNVWNLDGSRTFTKKAQRFGY